MKQEMYVVNWMLGKWERTDGRSSLQSRQSELQLFEYSDRAANSSSFASVGMCCAKCGRRKGMFV